jgi:hypothetical protein
MRPATGPTGDGEALEAEVVGEENDVVDLVDYTTAASTGRPSVPGPVVRHKADPEPPVELLVRPSLEPTSRRPVQCQDGEPVWFAPDREREHASVGSCHRL